MSAEVSHQSLYDSHSHRGFDLPVIEYGGTCDAWPSSWSWFVEALRGGITAPRQRSKFPLARGTGTRSWPLSQYAEATIMKPAHVSKVYENLWGDWSHVQCHPRKSILAHLERRHGNFALVLEYYRETIVAFRDIAQLGAVSNQLECSGFIALE